MSHVDEWHPPVLRLDGVAKYWEGTTGLAPVSLTLALGEIVVLQGRSGSGKSTLLALLAGWCLPDDGEIERSGEWAVGNGWRTWRHTSLVPQAMAPVSELTVRENVDVVLRWLGVSRRIRPALALHLLNRLDLVEESGRLPRETSLGQQQRLAVARAVAGTVADATPTVVLADEPTSHQDDEHTALVLEVLTEAAAAGAGVLVSSHDPQVAAAGRVVELVA